MSMLKLLWTMLNVSDLNWKTKKYGFGVVWHLYCRISVGGGIMKKVRHNNILNKKPSQLVGYQGYQCYSS